MYCLHVGGADGVGDGQHLLLFVMLGDEFVAVGAIGITWSKDSLVRLQPRGEGGY